MISYLNGTLLTKDEKTLTLDVAGVGYEVNVREELLAQTPVGSGLALFIHLNIKENALELYGFAQAEERQMFRLLLDVSGIGPRSALNILNTVKHDQLASAIQRQDVAWLSARGVGKKTAEKLVHELQDKVRGLALSAADTHAPHQDLIDALTSLGYSQNQIAQVLSRLPRTITSTEEQIREALKLLTVERS